MLILLASASVVLTTLANANRTRIVLQVGYLLELYQEVRSTKHNISPEGEAT
jgi:hypothetical protein